MFFAVRDIIHVVKWSPDNKVLGAAGRTGTLYVYDPQKNIRTHHLGHHNDQHSDFDTLSICWSPSHDGTIITGGYSGCAEIWDTTTGTPTMCYEEHSPEVKCFPPDSFPNRRTVYAVAFSPRGEYVASAAEDTTVRIWDAKTGKTYYVAICDDAQRPGSLLTWLDETMLISSGEGMEVVLWNAFSGRVLRTFQTPGIPQQARGSRVVSPDKTRLAVVSASSARIYNLSGEILLSYEWSGPEPEEDEDEYHYSRYPSQIAWSPHGQWLATSFVEEPLRIYIWDGATGKTLLTLKSPGAVGCLDWSPDGEMLAWGGTGYLETADLSRLTDTLPYSYIQERR